MKTQMDFCQLLIMVIHILGRRIVGSDHEEMILLGDIIFCVKHSFLCVYCYTFGPNTCFPNLSEHDAPCHVFIRRQQ